MNGKFDLGQRVVTMEVAKKMGEDPIFRKFCLDCIQTHKAANEDIPDPDERIFSSVYKYSDDVELWIYTDLDQGTTKLSLSSNS